MIALSLDPDHPKEMTGRAYIPLRFDPERDAWSALPDELAGCAHEIDAARACAEDLSEQWKQLSRLARTMRVFCEHPELSDFAGDGIDADMLQQCARELTRAVYQIGENVGQLLEHADAGHKILIGKDSYRVNDETGLIEPQP